MEKKKEGKEAGGAVKQTVSFPTVSSFIYGRQDTCCFLLCQQLFKEALKVHYGNEALIVNLDKSDPTPAPSSSIQPHISSPDGEKTPRPNGDNKGGR